MPIFRWCSRHNTRYPRGQRCPLCPPRQRSWAHRKHTTAVLERDGRRCRVCGTSENLQAAHTGTSYIDGGSSEQAELVTLCSTCHARYDRQRGR